MTTIFDEKKYPGLTGDNARVTHIEDRVLIRAVDRVAEEAVTIAMTPAQARALAQGIIAAADKAEAYEIPEVQCPYCGADCEAQYMDIGVGMQQVTPHVCDYCHAVEAGPYDGVRGDYDPETGWHEPLQKEADQ